jgi:hypothetical protein
MYSAIGAGGNHARTRLRVLVSLRFVLRKFGVPETNFIELRVSAASQEGRPHRDVIYFGWMNCFIVASITGAESGFSMYTTIPARSASSRQRSPKYALQPTMGICAVR